MYSFHSNRDCGPTPGSLLRPTPIYRQEQNASALEDEPDAEEFPIRSNRASTVRRPDYKTLQLSVVMHNPDSENGNSDWALMLEDGISKKAVCFRMAGGPSIGQAWKFEVETGTLNSFPTPDRRHAIATMPDHQCHDVYDAAVSAQEKFCQQWVIDVIYDLELQGIVPPGKASDLSEFIEEDLHPEIEPPYDDVLFIIEQDTARPFLRQIVVWILERPQWGANTPDQLDSRINELMLLTNRQITFRIWVEDGSDRIVMAGTLSRIMPLRSLA
ncbi:hypothetical protein FLONG3_10057 [Fusarium longipes]|uniref:Uncharacterized protein n=1 Tax=Fusarium longipes TaxID=694270 RepID=A0A395RT51_9HYPO|nr:hypothetical protein FLONG3_10057 [Fusarium longipes]